MEQNKDKFDKPHVALDIYVLAQNIRTGVYRVCDEIFNRISNSNKLRISYIVKDNLKKEAEDYLSNHLDEYNLNTYNNSDPSNEGDILLSPFGVAPDNWLKCEHTLHAHIIYDLIAVRRPGYFTPEAATEVCNIVGSLRPDTLIFAISEYTKMDLLFFRPDINPDDVVVIPLAANSSFTPCKDEQHVSFVLNKYNIPENAPYILSLATLEIRKNLDQVVRSFITYLENNPESMMNLVLSGMSGWKLTKLEEELSKAEKWRDRIILSGFIDDNDLSALYSGSLCFIYLSRYEGFGLPPLEAMACGTPVICSDNSSLPEVVGNDALLVDTNDTKATAEALEKLANSVELRNKLSAAGLERAKSFDWNKTADIVAKSLVTYYQQHKNDKNKTILDAEQKTTVSPDISTFKQLPHWVKTMTGDSPSFIHGGLRLHNTYKKDITDFPLISYVTVVKNNVHGISRTIKSVLEQTYCNIEHIIVDGVSTDGTLETIKHYSDRLDYYISEPDTGLYNALNKAIQLSRGSLICVLNSDDWLLPDSAKIAAAHLNYPDIPSLLCSAATVIDNDTQLYWKPSTVHSGSYFACANVCHNALYATRTAYETTGLYDDSYEIAADFEWIMRAYDSNVEFIYTDKPTVYYSLGGVSSNFLTHSMECMRVSHKRFPYLSRSEINGLYHSFFLFSNTSYRYDVDRPANRSAFINELNYKYSNEDFIAALDSATEHAYGNITSSFDASLKNIAIKYLANSPRAYSALRMLYHRIKHFRQ